MDLELLRKQFKGIGARLHVNEVAGRGQRAGIDIRADKAGEYFDIRLSATDSVGYEVVDLQPKMRHLLLLARRDSGKEKYLCGHDERHWFVCAVPERRGVASVVTAMEVLRPPEVRAAVERDLRHAKDYLNRHNEAFVRQGEWFFIPNTGMIVGDHLLHRNEPISRGRGSKPHMCQFLYRHGGEAVMVCSRHPSGVTIEQYNKIVMARPEAVRWNWVSMRRNAEVYVRGRISHPDHKTIVLNDWHRVLMNTEQEAPGSHNVVFLD